MRLGAMAWLQTVIKWPSSRKNKNLGRRGPKTHRFKAVLACFSCFLTCAGGQKQSVSVPEPPGHRSCEPKGGHHGQVDACGSSQIARNIQKSMRKPWKTKLK